MWWSKVEVKFYIVLTILAVLNERMKNISPSTSPNFHSYGRMQQRGLTQHQCSHNKLFKNPCEYQTYMTGCFKVLQHHKKWCVVDLHRRLGRSSWLNGINSDSAGVVGGDCNWNARNFTCQQRKQHSMMPLNSGWEPKWIGLFHVGVQKNHGN